MRPPDHRNPGRRGLLLAGAGALAGGWLAAPRDAAARQPDAARPGLRLSAADFGAVGDGRTDDTQALQNALTAAFSDAGALLTIPPGDYRITRGLQVTLTGELTRQHGIIAHGARLVSEISGGVSVLRIDSAATARFMLIEGLDILGNGKDGHGIEILCESKEHYLYNFCLRDVVVQNCGGDGCHLEGNVFEGQLINCYLRHNGGNGATFAHGRRAGILSAMHVMGCVFGENAKNGVAMTQGCYDVGFHGCYFLLSGRFGLQAENGCTLLTHCGFENNHEAARDFAGGGAGISLQGFATLVGCTAYSMFKQQRLIDAYVTGRLVMVGCAGSGDADARQAGLARLRGNGKATATVVGCSGRISYQGGFEGTELGNDGAAGGLRCGAGWQSRNQLRLGDYHLWVDRSGRLRIKDSPPQRDDDGAAVGV